MPCYRPLKGYRAREVNATGKRSIVFSARQGFLNMPVDLPCSQCIGCRLERSRQWAIRCVHESKLHEENSFLTLTYSPSFLPEGGTLVKKHFQDFMKRYRFWLGEKKIRYFHCGEYGERKGRPHYHAIIFGHDFSDKVPEEERNGFRYFSSKSLEEIWGLGQCRIGAVTFESAAYVARYITKKVTNKAGYTDPSGKYWPPASEVYGDRVPEYVTMSRRPGIARGHYEKFKSDIYPSDEVILRGIVLRPPKFYAKIFEIEDPEVFQALKAKRFWASREALKKESYDRLAVREKVHELKAQLLSRGYEDG